MLKDPNQRFIIQIRIQKKTLLAVNFSHTVNKFYSRISYRSYSKSRIYYNVSTSWSGVTIRLSAGGKTQTIDANCYQSMLMDIMGASLGVSLR